MKSISFLKSRIYEIFMSLLILIFIIISSGIIYKLFFSFGYTLKPSQKVYLLISQDNINFLKTHGYSVSNYNYRINLIKKYLKDYFNIQEINEKELDIISPDSVVLALDIFNLSSYSLNKLLNFLKKGGRVIFNYHFAYFINGKYQGNKILTKITHLKYTDEVKTDSAFLIANTLSPLGRDIYKIKRYDYIIYDPVPLFHSNTIPDLVMTNWSVKSPVLYKGKLLSLKDDGVMWHGNYGKGTYIYYSFPSYTLTDLNKEFFEFVLINSIKFLKRPITIVKYPYINKKNAVFISEDTEYQYQNLAHFSVLAKKYEINVTAFCVGYLAKQYLDLTYKVSKNPYLEIGSHSYSHKKIVGTSKENMLKEILGSKLLLEKITNKQVIGFRPPREEIDSKMAKILTQSKYKYIMEKSKPYIYPKEEYKNLITIPRHGTDDYEYIINLDWNKTQILNQIINESNFLTYLGILYTLSVHTHLLSYGSNITILENYFKYLKKHKISTLKGKDIAKIAKEYKNITINSQITREKIIFNITNDNLETIKNFTFRVYYLNLNSIFNLSPEIIGVNLKTKYNLKEKFVDITIDKLAPKSKLAIFGDYK